MKPITYIERHLELKYEQRGPVGRLTVIHRAAAKCGLNCYGLLREGPMLNPATGRVEVYTLDAFRRKDAVVFRAQRSVADLRPLFFDFEQPRGIRTVLADYRSKFPG